MNKVEEADGAGRIVWNINITYLWWSGKIWVSYPQHQENNQIWILYIFRHSDVNGPSRETFWHIGFSQYSTMVGIATFEGGPTAPRVQKKWRANSLPVTVKYPPP